MTPDPRSLLATLALLLLPLLAMADDHYAGDVACGECHQAEYEAWQGSHHDLALQHATADTVLGNFSDQQLDADGVQSRFTREGDAFYVTTENAEGQPQRYKVVYTFGVTPLQQYLVETGGGRLQALRQSWDARPAEQGGQRWFHMYPGESIPPGDELHWTGGQQNWNYMCADCHSTRLQKNYMADDNAYQTRFAIEDVSCEACHGPGQQHVNWARQAGADTALGEGDVSRGLAVLFHDRRDAGWVMGEGGIARRSQPRSTDTEIQVCASCHSRRGALADRDPAHPVYLDHYRPALLSEGLYHADGQIQDEVYVWGSFLQSKMHQAGVTCSDCHEPHSLELRAPGEQVCAQCHAPAVFDSRDHHGHEPDSAGGDCLACHMPATDYMVVDPRRDHSLRSPRPDLSQRYGTPNACSNCHQDLSAEQMTASFQKLFPSPAAPFQNWTSALSLARQGRPEAEVALMRVIHRDTTPDIVRATAIMELGNFLSPLSGQVLQQALSDDSDLVRLAALDALQGVPAEHRYRFANHLLSDPSLAIRTEAGRVLATTPVSELSAEQQQQLQSAINEYIQTQEYSAERPEALTNLGNLYGQQGRADAARSEYRKAQQLDPAYIPAWVNHASLEQAQGDPAAVLAVLDEGLKANPRGAALYHSRGLALVRAGQPEQAVEALARAAALAPDNARFAYVYGVALNSTGRQEEALRWLQEAQSRHPSDREILFALASIERDRGRMAEALRWARELEALNPADPAARQLLQSLGQPPQP